MVFSLKKRIIKGYLICESPFILETPQIMSSNNLNVLSIKTTLQDADVPNRNKRIYGKKVLIEGLAAKYIVERLATKTWYGEAGHPLKPDLQRQLYTDQSNISHIVTKTWWEGNLLKGIVETANTSVGRDFKGLIEQGCKVGFSLRAIGPLTQKKGEYVEVLSPLTMYCYDEIIHPSHAVAYMDEIIAPNMASNSGLNESASVFIPFYEEQAIDYIKNESANFKLLSNQFEFGTNNITLSKDNRKIILQENEEKMVILVEDFISKELNDYMRRF